MIDFKNALQEKSGIASGRLELLTGFPPTVLQVSVASHVLKRSPVCYKLVTVFWHKELWKIL